MKKWLFGLFLLPLLTFFAVVHIFAGKTETNWEVLEISDVFDCRLDFNVVGRECRNYNYLTFGASLTGTASLEWMKSTGWELAGVLNRRESADKLYFKRRYDRSRTEKEIAALKNESQKQQARKGLTDLDEAEFRQQFQPVRQANIARLRTALEQTAIPALKIIGVDADAVSAEKTYLRAEIVLDGTSVLLRDGNAYRSSEADRFFGETVQKILDTLDLSANAPIFSNAQRIAKGDFMPVKIGEFRLHYAGVALKISVVVNDGERQTIVAQGWVYGDWKPDPQ